MTDELSSKTPVPFSEQRRRLNQQAKWAAIAVSVGSVPYLLATFSFGLISGLIVVMLPGYACLFIVALLVIVVSLCLARRWYGLARFTGASVALMPGGGLAGWYISELVFCERGADKAACLNYLNGSPLLPLGVAMGVALSGLAVGLVLFWIQRVKREQVRALESESFASE